jgi:hypothetical protein
MNPLSDRLWPSVNHTQTDTPDSRQTRTLTASYVRIQHTQGDTPNQPIRMRTQRKGTVA